MKSIITYVLTFSLINQAAWSQSGEGHPSAIKNDYKSSLIKAYVESFTKNFVKTVDDYNDNRNNPDYFVKNLKSKEDRKVLKSILHQNRDFKLPKLERKNAIYSAKVGQDRFSFDTVSAYQGHMFINGKKFDVSKGKTLKDKVENLTKFLATNKNHTSFFSPLMNLMIPEAQAFVCGGFCVAALIGGSALLAMGAYNAMKSLTGNKEGFDDLDEMNKYIEDQARECKNQLAQVQEHDGNDNLYKNAPGAYSTFGNIKKFFNDEYKLDKQKLSNELYKTLGGEDFKDCPSFARALVKSSSTIGSRTDRINLAMEGLTPEQKICNKHKEFVKCLEDFYEVHQSHIDRYGDPKINLNFQSYDKESGVYDDQDRFDIAK